VHPVRGQGHPGGGEEGCARGLPDGRLRGRVLLRLLPHRGLERHRLPDRGQHGLPEGRGDGRPGSARADPRGRGHHARRVHGRHHRRPEPAPRQDPGHGPGRPQDSHPRAGAAGRALQVRDDAALAHAGQGRALAQVPRLRGSPRARRAEGDRGREEGEGRGPRLTLPPRPIPGQGRGRGRWSDPRPALFRIPVIGGRRACNPAPLRPIYHGAFRGQPIRPGGRAMPSPSSLRALAAIVAAAAVLAGCGAGDAGAPRWVAETDTIGDTIVVRTVSGGVWPAGVTVVPEVTIGKFEGEDEYIFGEIVALTVAADGSIFLYDRHAKALRQYAPDGTYVRTIGREGGWPGEYRRPDAGLTITPDGRLPASPCCGSRRRDPRARRIGGEGRDGAPRYGEHALHRPELALRRARHPGHQARVPLLFVAADGRIWVQTHQPAFEIEAEEET